MMKILNLSPGKKYKNVLMAKAFTMVLLIFSVHASAQNSVDFLLFPSAPVVGVNQSFTVDVRVKFNAGELDAAEVHLNFDPAYLTVTSVTTPASDSLPITAIPIAPLATINATGQIDYAAGTPSNFFNSDFILLSVTFTATAIPPGGTTPIDFNLVFPRQTDAARNGESILRAATGAVVTITTALPVGIKNLTAKSQDKKVVLNWTTAFESNNRGFEIQRSVDGANWTAAGFVNSNGNGNNERHYQFVDDNLSPRRYQYRLKQQDLDGHFSYTSIVLATVFGNKLFVLEQNQPNPFSSSTSIQFSLAEKTKVKLLIVDPQGRLVRTLLDETKDAGTHVVTFNARTLSSGVYYYKLEANEFADAKKMLVK